ncbi:MAG: MBL fold metallo-hydrolase [Gemmatimonadota bacterium]|nr:MBL fold metallo-hydrolase [Gemmatimonadota bacterium]
MRIQTYTGGNFGQNAYLAICEASDVAVAIDPGGGTDRMVADLEERGHTLEAIVLTHAHLDHVEGVHLVRRFAPDVPIYLHPDDFDLYRSLPQQAAMFGLRADPQPEPTDELVPGRRFEFGQCGFDIRFTPGHAPGHVILVAPEDGLAVTGDVVFQGSIGRTDLPGGDFKTLMASIRQEVLSLPDEITMYPGHGPPTTVGAERATNPFLIPHYGGELA